MESEGCAGVYSQSEVVYHALLIGRTLIQASTLVRAAISIRYLVYFQQTPITTLPPTDLPGPWLLLATSANALPPGHPANPHTAGDAWARRRPGQL